MRAVNLDYVEVQLELDTISSFFVRHKAFRLLTCEKVLVIALLSLASVCFSVLMEITVFWHVSFLIHFLGESKICVRVC